MNGTREEVLFSTQHQWYCYWSTTFISGDDALKAVDGDELLKD